jgi:hypothetical protein
MHPGLAETQRLFWQLVSAPEGVRAALATPGSEGARLRAGVEAIIASDARLSAVERLDIYAEMYFYRLHDCLAEDFRAVHAVIGPTRFHNLVTDYLLAHPSTHPSLRFAGRHLPRLLDSHPLAAQWPFLADLARFEWAIIDAFDAADAAPLTARDLESVPAPAWAALRLRLVPSVRLLEARAAVQEVWSQVDRCGTPTAPLVTPTNLLVWRSDLRVFHRPVEAAEYAALQRVRGGATFGAICEDAAARGGDDAAATTLFRIVEHWLADGLVMGPLAPAPA